MVLCESQQWDQAESEEYKPSEQVHKLCDAINGRMTGNMKFRGIDLLWIQTLPE